MAADRLRDAASAALEFLTDYQYELIESYCVLNPDGTRDPSTADEIESEHLREVEALIEQVRLALNEGTPQ